MNIFKIEVIIITEREKLHIEQLNLELSECREDERNSQSQIISTISTAATVLGIFLAANWIENDKISDIDQEIIFCLCTLIFCTALCYITCLGIVNVLRFHYIRDLEDQLTNYHENESGKVENLYWMSFSSPLTTRNIFHIKSSYSALHYINYSFATLCAILFCIMTLFVEYTFLNKTSFIVNSCLIIICIVCFISFLSFSLSFKSYAIYEFCKKKSKFDREKRISNEIHKNAKEKWKGIIYYFYPKQKDFQKSVLIILGYISGLVLNNNFDLEHFNIFYIVFSWIIYDFLFYQGRYLLNDLRNIKEDIDMGRNNRLPVSIFGKRKAITFSIVVILVRIILLIIIIFYMPTNVQNSLKIVIFLLFSSTVLYEISRTKGWDKMIFFSVSLGYPLRYLGGFLFYGKFNFTLLVILISLACYGEYCAVIPWCYEIESILKSKNELYKSHYMFIVKKYTGKNENNNEDNNKDKINSIFNQKRLVDGFWDWFFIISIFLLSILIFININNIYNGIILEFIFLYFVYMFTFASKGQIVILLIIFLLKIIEICILSSSFYIFINLLQLLYIVSYGFIKFLFDPDFNFFVKMYGIFMFLINMIKIIIRYICKFIIGKSAYNILFKNDNEIY